MFCYRTRQNRPLVLTNLNNSVGKSYTYTYQHDGNQITKDDGEKTNSYMYNNIGQLLSEIDGYSDPNTNSYNSTNYTYDSKGNRILETNASELGMQYETNYNYDRNNKLLQTSKDDISLNSTAITSYEYDSNGNMLFKGIEEYTDQYSGVNEDISLTTPGSNSDVDYYTYYSYNTRNQLKQVENDKAKAIYRYDAVGRRISKTINEQTTNQRWDGSNIVSESGANSAVYYRGRNIIAQNASDDISYYIYNGHGDTISLANTSGTIIADADYSAFGIGGESLADYTPFRYCGEYTDDETGLVYLRNRYYDSSSGRFTQEDPIHSGVNWYAYCGNNPVNFIDPWGLKYLLSGLSDENQQKFLNLTISTANDSRYRIDDDGYLCFDPSMENTMGGDPTDAASVINSIIESDAIIDVVVGDKDNFSPGVIVDGKKIMISSKNFSDYLYTDKEQRTGTVQLTQNTLDGNETDVGMNDFDVDFAGKKLKLSAKYTLAHESTHASAWIYALEKNMMVSSEGGFGQPYTFTYDSYCFYTEGIAILVGNATMLQLGTPMLKLDARGTGAYCDGETEKIYGGNQSYGGFNKEGEAARYISRYYYYTHGINLYYRNEMWRN